MKGNTMATQGVLRMVTETNELIVNPVGDVIHFRGKVGLQDQVEILYASSPMALNTLTYVAQYFTEVRNNGTLKIFKRTEPNTPQPAPGADADGRTTPTPASEEA